MAANSVIKKLGAALHSAVSRNKTVAAFYLTSLGRVCRSAPDGKWKEFVSNSIHSAEWPDIEFALARTSLPGDVKIRLVPHLNEFDFQALLYRQLHYEAEVFAWLGTRSYKTIVEIGANVGVFSLYFAGRFPEARVYAFEPSRKAFARLIKNAEANHFANLFPFNCAIFSESGFLNFHEPVGHLTNGSLDADFAGAYSNQVITTPVPVLAASALESFFANPPVLVKVDAEGAEPQLLGSMAELISRYLPDLLIEVLPQTATALNALPFIANGSYELFNLRKEGPVPQERFVATEHRDYALVPKSSI